MRLLLDTHILLWAMIHPRRLPRVAAELIESEDNQLFFSVASVWEAAIKRGRGRSDFAFDPKLFRKTLLENEFSELPVLGTHVLAVSTLPALHKDPFDRILVAQATVEGMVLVTSDQMIFRYPGPIKLV